MRFSHFKQFIIDESIEQCKNVIIFVETNDTKYVLL